MHKQDRWELHDCKEIYNYISQEITKLLLQQILSLKKVGAKKEGGWGGWRDRKWGWWPESLFEQTEVQTRLYRGKTYITKHFKLQDISYNCL